MTNLSFKQKLIIGLVVIGLIVVVVFQKGPGNQKSEVGDQKSELKQQTPTQSDEPRLLSTNPSPLNNATILPTQPIEFTFNQPLENRGELKFEIKPEAQVDVHLSNDKKTAKITPTKPYLLGQTYSINIKTETKFDNKKKLPDGLNFTFKTINYRGV